MLRLINLPVNHIKQFTTQRENGPRMTLQKLAIRSGNNLKVRSTAYVEDFHVKAFRSLESGLGLPTQLVARFSSKLPAQPNKSNHAIYSSKTSKGLLSHDKGRTFRTILSVLDECGYDAEWQLCNSKNFGVPQNRERVIIIGHLRNTSTLEVFFDAGENGPTTSTNEINDLLPVGALRHGRRGTVLGTDSLSSALAATDYKLPKQILQVGNISSKDYFGGNPQTGRVYDASGLAPTLNTMTGGDRQPKIITQKDNLRIRKLTPRECWRLQGFPDWTFDHAKASGVSNSQLYKQAGNSVTVPLIEFVAKRLDNSDCPKWEVNE